MPSLNTSLDFLSKIGLFQNANRQIKDASFEVLNAVFQSKLKTNDLEHASLIAKKTCILYGLKGLYLYVPVELLKIKRDKDQGEMIDQALMQLLSLILYIEHNIVSLNDKDWVKTQKSICLGMCDSQQKRNNLEQEAEILSCCYPYLSTDPKFLSQDHG